MKYFQLDSLGKYDDDKFCISNSIPEEIDDDNSALDYGGVLEGDMPDDPYDIKMYLDEDSPKHIKIGSFLSTVDDYVMFHTDVVTELENFDIGDVEFLPFSLINHKGKLHSKDYRFVIPKTKLDVLHDDESVVERDNNGVVIGIDKVVLSRVKLALAPDMFRISDLGLMGFSETLAMKLDKDYTNFLFEEIEVT